MSSSPVSVQDAPPEVVQPVGGEVLREAVGDEDDPCLGRPLLPLAAGVGVLHRLGRLEKALTVALVAWTKEKKRFSFCFCKFYFF